MRPQLMGRAGPRGRIVAEQRPLWFEWLQTLEELQKLVGGGLVSARRGGRWSGPVQGLLLEGEVGVQVDLRGGRRLVAEPESDDGGVDAGVQQAHRRGVPQDVR